MEHLTEEQLSPYLFDAADLSTAVRRHLAQCQACRVRWQSMQRLVRELDVARRSQPSAEQVARYEWFFEHVQQQPTWKRTLQTIQMLLTLDSRQRPALQGLRSGSTLSYRLLYSTDVADVELLVEPDGLMRRIEGEVLTVQTEIFAPPALVELFDPASRSARPLTAVESSAEGRFHLQDIAPGRYRLAITPAQGPLLAVEDVTIT